MALGGFWNFWAFCELQELFTFKACITSRPASFSPLPSAQQSYASRLWKENGLRSFCTPNLNTDEGTHGHRLRRRETREEEGDS